MKTFPPSVFLLLLAVAGLVLPARAATLAADPGAINARNVASVKNAVRKIAAAGNVPAAWTGNVAAGNAGAVSAAYQAAALRTVNIFRVLAGLKPVVFDSTLSAKCAKAALMMSANKTLSHTPPTSFKFYTADGAEAAGHSNLFLGFAGAFTIPGYIDDGSAGNEVVGHRRWILWSQSQVMGSGDVLGGGEFQPANALWVLPTGATPAPSTHGGFVAWPYRGSIPNKLVFRRWSFAVPLADLTGATVKVSAAGKNIPVTVIDKASVGFGDNTIVFQPKLKYTAAAFGTIFYQSHLKPPPKPVTYTVTVSNVKLNTGSTKTFTYRVKVFRM